MTLSDTATAAPNRSTSSVATPHADHLALLESHAIFVLREVAAESERPVLLFSGGKDSAV
jgi:sulfate adenylyltransferase subunit 2